VSFFELPPTPEPSSLHFHQAPTTSAYIPGIVRVEQDLGRSDRAAIVLRSLSVFPDGIEFHLRTHLSSAANEVYEAQLLERMTLLRHRAMRSSALGIATTTSSQVVRDKSATGSEPSPSDRVSLRRMASSFGRFGFDPFDEIEDNVRFGILLSDGSKVTTLESYWPVSDEQEPVIGLECEGSSGSPADMGMEVYLWPLPPPGPVVVVTEWPTFGIPETRVDLDAEAIADAAQRARPVFAADARLPSHETRLGCFRDFNEHTGPRDDD